MKAKKTIKDYFKTVDTFTKDLPAAIQRPSVQAVREELKVVQECANGKRGEYQKVSLEDKLSLAALLYFKSTTSFPSLKESTVHGWKNVYCTELLSGLRKRDDAGYDAQNVSHSGHLSGLPLRKDLYCFWLPVHTEELLLQTQPKCPCMYPRMQLL